MWKVLLPFLKPLVPVAVDYARARMQTMNEAHARAAANEQAVDSVEARLMDFEARLEALAGICQQYGAELSVLSADLNARMRSARKWAAVLLVWNVALTILIIVALLR